MIRNISLGIYFPGKSILHRLQARTKLLVIFWLVIFLTIANQREWHFAPYLVVGTLLVAAIALSSISFRVMWQRLWLLILLAFLGSIANIFFPSSSSNQVLYALGPVFIPYALLYWATVVYSLLMIAFLLLPFLPMLPARQLRKQRWFKRIRVLVILIEIIALAFFWFTRDASINSTLTVGPVNITYDGVWLEMSFFIVFLFLYAFSLLLTMTTTPVALVEGMSILLRPLRRLRLPVDDFALMTLIALRFIPTLTDETGQLIKAQAARGSDLTHGSLRQRIQSLAALFLPFIHATLRRASELATALDARGYQFDGQQTYLHEKSLSTTDYLVMGTVVLVTAATLFL
ncbi:MAG TPA: energy-coupling factor transporter transmembrane component T [Ktedonobacteraceae bacterium]|nr:energy-coupling factor transporter transmembrane component T [Ktedonobacteraceae bacterium]